VELEPARCYRALLSRDRRFDGRFFIGVTTTGIYCRPICPSPPPRARNVRFYACAAAAQAAGFRPCLRCRPETAPGTPAWEGSPAVVRRALRLIAQGALDDDDVEAFAERLGVGGRHLRRLFETHLGASPAAVARASRAHFAKRLLDETDLRMTEVAFSAGFRGVRQFNQAMRASFRATPRELRARRPIARRSIGRRCSSS
jgi:AraC family transcriptional regulator of adaptative response / DNA-3-methyladenine glycosylase II